MENGERWTVASLKDYTDTKFQTVEKAAEEARIISDRALAEAVLSREKFLSKIDYDARHNIIEERIQKLTETPWTTYAAVGMIFIAIIGGFWTLVDSKFNTLEKRDNDFRSDISKVHDILVDEKTFVETIKRLDQRNANQDVRTESLLTKGQFEAWKGERDALINQIITRIDKLYAIIEEQNRRIADIKAERARS